MSTNNNNRNTEESINIENNNDYNKNVSRPRNDGDNGSNRNFNLNPDMPQDSSLFQSIKERSKYQPKPVRRRIIGRKKPHANVYRCKYAGWLVSSLYGKTVPNTIPYAGVHMGYIRSHLASSAYPALGFQYGGITAHLNTNTRGRGGIQRRGHSAPDAMHFGTLKATSSYTAAEVEKFNEAMKNQQRTPMQIGSGTSKPRRARRKDPSPRKSFIQMENEEELKENTGYPKPTFNMIYSLLN